MSVRFKWAVLLPTLLFLTIAAGSANAQAEYKPGAKVAEFALKDENAKTVKLSNYKGQVVALVFYASW